MKLKVSPDSKHRRLQQVACKIHIQVINADGPHSALAR